jgi:aspartyl protease family protein
LSLFRILIVAAVVGFAAFQVPKFGPQMIEQMAATDSGPAPEVEQTPDPAQVIAVAPEVAREEPRLPRKIAGGNSSTLGGGGVTLRAGANGHYLAEARINGIGVDMMVDTGATVVALSEDAARKLSIFPSPEDYTVPINTANGMVYAAPVMLTNIRIGTISVPRVEAVVIRGKVLGANLLGMSFLNRLSRFTVGNNEMVLKQ